MEVEQLEFKLIEYRVGDKVDTTIYGECIIIEIKTSWFARVRPIKKTGIVDSIYIPFKNLK